MSFISRYFVAIVPPEPVFSEVMRMKKDVSENYSSHVALRSPAHLTLHMPFLWKENNEQKLIEALDSFASDKTLFDISLHDYGCFEPRVIYIKVEENSQLVNFQKALEVFAKNKLNLFNANYQQYPFHPHITIAFRDLKKNSFSEAWNEFKTKKYTATFSVKSFSLLKHNGKQWLDHITFNLKTVP